MSIECPISKDMIDPDLALALENPTWVQVLQAYQLAHHELGQSVANEIHQVEVQIEAADSTDDSGAEPDTEEGPKQRRSARWMARIHHVEGLAKEELSRVHGRLIAYGFLKCDLAERTAEVVYQLTLTGKQVLTHAAQLMTGEPGIAAEEQTAAA